MTMFAAWPTGTQKAAVSDSGTGSFKLNLKRRSARRSGWVFASALTGLSGVCHEALGSLLNPAAARLVPGGRGEGACTARNHTGSGGASQENQNSWNLSLATTL